MSQKKIGVNGFGRIGRYFTRLAILDPNTDVTLVNDLSDIQTLMHLFKYDSVHGRFDLGFEIKGNQVFFSNGKKLSFSQEKNPEFIPWAQYGTETVVECTGLFLTKDSASKHLKGGVQKVILSAPAKDSQVKTIVLGVNEDSISEDDKILSNASCTTNNVAPILKVLMPSGDI